MNQERYECGITDNDERGTLLSAGDFYIDPWKGVPRAVITHGHSDHARWGSDQYLCTTQSGPILKSRLGEAIQLQTVNYGESIQRGGCRLSLHPAGHILGAAQVRIEVGGEVAVVTGDYKLQSDPTCAAYEPVKCNLLVTESTFGLPAFEWFDTDQVFDEINQWWRSNQASGKASVLYAYALGKSQRILAGVDSSIGPIFIHGALIKPTQIYRDLGIAFTCDANRRTSSKRV